jgi:general secretion pathway protein G
MEHATRAGEEMPGARRPRWIEAGFTLLELMTVIAIVGILAAVAVPQYRVSLIQSKEAVLREDLFRFRDVIDQYQADKGKYPASLDVLAEEGYLRRVPNDPFTGAPNWELVPAEPDPNTPDEPPGIYDVHSTSPETSLGGTPYKEW